jgi:hypothetical protein
MAKKKTTKTLAPAQAAALTVEEAPDPGFLDRMKGRFAGASAPMAMGTMEPSTAAHQVLRSYGESVYSATGTKAKEALRQRTRQFVAMLYGVKNPKDIIIGQKALDSLVSVALEASKKTTSMDAGVYVAHAAREAFGKPLPTKLGQTILERGKQLTATMEAPVAKASWLGRKTMKYGRAVKGAGGLAAMFAVPAAIAGVVNALDQGPSGEELERAINTPSPPQTDLTDLFAALDTANPGMSELMMRDPETAQALMANYLKPNQQATPRGLITLNRR